MDALAQAAVPRQQALVSLDPVKASPWREPARAVLPKEPVKTFRQPEPAQA